MLEVCNLSVSYGAHRAVEKANLTLAPGEVVAVLGSNGAGKSSLLRGLLGLAPAQGQIFLDGQELTPLVRKGQTEALVASGLVLVPERGGVFRSLTLKENLLLGAFRSGDPPWETLFALFPQLRERLSQRVGSMSGGEQRMVALARALAARPRYLLLDEPTLGLAPILARNILEFLRIFARQGMGVLLVEQNAHLALAVASRAYLMEEGRLVREGNAESLRTDPQVRRAYLGG